MSDRNLRSRSRSIDSTDSRRQEIELDEEYTCFNQEANITVQEVQVSELETSNTGIININDNYTEINCSNSSKVQTNIPVQNQMQEFVAQVMKSFREEAAKQTENIKAALAKQTIANEQIVATREQRSAELVKQLTEAYEKQTAELISAVEKLRSEVRRDHEALAKSLTYKFETDQSNLRKELKTKIESEITTITAQVTEVRDNNKDDINQLSEAVDKCNGRLSVHIQQNRRALNIQGQELLNVTREMQNKLDSQKEQSDLVIANISQEVVQQKGYVDDKINSVTCKVQQEIAKINDTLGELQNKVAVGNSDSVQASLAENAIVRVPNCDQASTSGNSVTSKRVNHVNGHNENVERVTAVSSDNQSLISIHEQSGNGNNVSVIPDHQCKSVRINDITLPCFSDSIKQVPLHFLREPDLYFNL